MSQHFYLACFFIQLCSDSNVFGFRDHIKHGPGLGSVCQRDFVLLSDDAGFPLRVTKAYFQKPSSLEQRALTFDNPDYYCLIQSQTSLRILHVSTDLTHVGMKRSRTQRTESLMQKAETLVNVAWKLLVALCWVSLRQGKTRIPNNLNKSPAECSRARDRWTLLDTRQHPCFTLWRVRL